MRDPNLSPKKRAYFEKRSAQTQREVLAKEAHIHNQLPKIIKLQAIRRGYNVRRARAQELLRGTSEEERSDRVAQRIAALQSPTLVKARANLQRNLSQAESPNFISKLVASQKRKDAEKEKEKETVPLRTKSLQRTFSAYGEAKKNLPTPDASPQPPDILPVETTSGNVVGLSYSPNPNPRTPARVRFLNEGTATPGAEVFIAPQPPPPSSPPTPAQIQVEKARRMSKGQTSDGGSPKARLFEAKNL